MHILMPDPCENSAHWEDPLLALAHVAQSLDDSFTSDSCLRTVKFMAYELASLCESKSEDEIYRTLQKYFFNDKNFRVKPGPHLLNDVLEQRAGCGMAISLLYMHFAQNLGLRLQLVHWPLHSVLKWDRQNNKSCYLDLEQQGQLLSEEALLKMINRHREQVSTLELSEALTQYLTYILISLRQTENQNDIHRAYNLLLQLDPENTRLIGERALLRKNLGLIKESLNDFKRYFAFTNRDAASPEIVNAYEDLRKREWREHSAFSEN